MLFLAILIVGLTLLSILAFEVWMFVSVIKNRHIDSTRKVLWAVGMVVLHPFVAMAYYFTDYKLTLN